MRLREFSVRRLMKLTVRSSSARLPYPKASRKSQATRNLSKKLSWVTRRVTRRRVNQSSKAKLVRRRCYHSSRSRIIPKTQIKDLRTITNQRANKTVQSISANRIQSTSNKTMNNLQTRHLIR